MGSVRTYVLTTFLGACARTLSWDMSVGAASGYIMAYAFGEVECKRCERAHVLKHVVREPAPPRNTS